ncbi:hypothetical protein KIPB_016326, partial [Kipferlia bialata]|eukprot:g16326.t1
MGFDLFSLRTLNDYEPDLTDNSEGEDRHVGSGPHAHSVDTVQWTTPTLAAMWQGCIQSKQVTPGFADEFLGTYCNWYPSLLLPHTLDVDGLLQTPPVLPRSLVIHLPSFLTRSLDLVRPLLKKRWRPGHAEAPSLSLFIRTLSCAAVAT